MALLHLLSQAHFSHPHEVACNISWLAQAVLVVDNLMQRYPHPIELFGISAGTRAILGFCIVALQLRPDLFSSISAVVSLAPACPLYHFPLLDHLATSDPNKAFNIIGCQLDSLCKIGHDPSTGFQSIRTFFFSANHLPLSKPIVLSLGGASTTSITSSKTIPLSRRGSGSHPTHFYPSPLKQS